MAHKNDTHLHENGFRLHKNGTQLQKVVFICIKMVLLLQKWYSFKGVIQDIWY